MGGQAGPARVQVTGPRIPCAVFAGWLDETHWVKRFAGARRPGAYLRVLREARSAPGIGSRWCPAPPSGSRSRSR